MGPMVVAAAAAVAASGGPAPPVSVPTIPDAIELQSTLAICADGLLATMLDVYSYFGRLGSSLLQHSSSTGVQHEHLEAAINAQDGVTSAIEARIVSEEARLAMRCFLLTQTE